MRKVSYSYAGDYYQKIRNDKKSYEALIKILKIDKAAFEKDSANFSVNYLAKDYISLGFHYRVKGDYEEARNFYQQALLFCSEEDGSDKMTVYNNVAETYKAEGTIPEALANYDKALRLAQKQEDYANLSLLYNNLADLYSTIQPDSALYFLNLLKPLLSENANIDRANYHQISADINRHLKNYRAVEGHLLAALQLRKIAFENHHPDIAFTYRHLGMLYAQQNRYEEALKNYQLAMTNVSDKLVDTVQFVANPSLIHNINDRLEFLSILKHKSKSLRAINQPQAAKSTLQLAIQLIDQIRYNYLAEGSKYALLERAMPIYEQAIDLAVEMG
ncbi:MAG: tetratricopeptide repeat protein, partial [Bacteroidota bacterium]